MEKWIIQIVGYATSDPCPLAGRFVLSFDFDAHDGRSRVETKLNAEEATEL